MFAFVIDDTEDWPCFNVSAQNSETEVRIDNDKRVRTGIDDRSFSMTVSKDTQNIVSFYPDAWFVHADIEHQNGKSHYYDSVITGKDLEDAVLHAKKEVKFLYDNLMQGQKTA